MSAKVSFFSSNKTFAALIISYVSNLLGCTLERARGRSLLGPQKTEQKRWKPVYNMTAKAPVRWWCRSHCHGALNGADTSKGTVGHKKENHFWRETKTFEECCWSPWFPSSWYRLAAMFCCPEVTCFIPPSGQTGSDLRPGSQESNFQDDFGIQDANIPIKQLNNGGKLFAK